MTYDNPLNLVVVLCVFIMDRREGGGGGCGCVHHHSRNFDLG